MKTSTHESDRPEFTPLIFTATRRQDYNWYAQQGSALVALEDAPRALLPAIERLSITQPVSCASLFRYQTADGLCCAVAWSGIRRGEVDHIGRGLLYSLLVDFRADQTAACFYAGLLKDWWPNRKEGVPELSQHIGEALSALAQPRL